MPANTPDKWRLGELNRTIERLDAETAQLQAAAAERAKAAARAAWKLRRLQVARTVRAPTASLELWPVGLIVIGGLLAGVLALALVGLFTSSNVAAIGAFLIVAAASAGVFALLLYMPSPEALPAALTAAEAERHLADAAAGELADKLTTARQEYSAALEERRELMASGQVQRAALLQRPWKAMPAGEWEDFVVEVCRTLGASVERPPRTTEKDAQLIAAFAERRVAIVVRGEGAVVNSGAVQDALAGRQRHRCEGAAVIVNRRFTGAAQDFARHNGCVLVGVEEFPDVVMGKLLL